MSTEGDGEDPLDFESSQALFLPEKIHEPQRQSDLKNSGRKIDTEKTYPWCFFRPWLKYIHSNRKRDRYTSPLQFVLYKVLNFRGIPALQCRTRTER